MDQIIELLATHYPRLRFTPSDTFCWSPETMEVLYKADIDQPRCIWSLLHETGHGILNHQTYWNDLELLAIELAAWEKAKQLAAEFAIRIDEEHIQDCLDTYRDWVYRRSICPSCTTKSLQQSNSPLYRCFNCHTTWKVSTSRFCRAYRSKQAPTKIATRS